MDEEDDTEENVNSILAQESSELLTILSCQSSTVIMSLYQMMPSNMKQDINYPASSAAALTEPIKAMLEYFREASAADCSHFLQSVCMLCENIPMHLESRLMSVAGYANTDVIQFPTTETTTLRNTDENSSPSRTDEKLSLPLSPHQLVKRPRIDHWEQYLVAVVSLQLSRWERLSERLVREVSLDNVWVSLRMANRGRDRPDQTPCSVDRGSRTPEPDGDYGFMDTKMTLETFLQGCKGKVAVLFGQSGSGKTLLMSSLGHQWAHGLGPIPSSFLFVLLEFRQLNCVSRPISLSELLFQHYLPPIGGDNEKRVILDYLLSNPEQSCWVFDGYDEFHSKLTRQEVCKGLLDPEHPRPVADLISGLLNRQLLPGCTVVVTCRATCRDLEGISDKMGQLLGWDYHDIKEYVRNFFEVKGHAANRGLEEQAVDLLLSTRHLLAMSSIPGLCNMCCICLSHLLQEGSNTRSVQVPEERGSETRKKNPKKEDKGLQMAGGGRGEEGNGRGSLAQGGDQEGRRRIKDTMIDVTNGRAQPPLTQAEIPSTLTQVYLTVLVAFLSCDPLQRGRKDAPKTMTTQQSTVYTLSQYRYELCELSHLAWTGLESNKILFMEEDISPDVLKFSVMTGLFSQVELRREDGTLANSYCFIHLTLQEFLAALRIMTSKDVDDMQLKKRFSLKTRWTTKSDQRTLFDSLYLYVCGLASQQCTSALIQLAKTSDGTECQKWVQKRQALVLKLLKNLGHSNTLTGPKVLELCHCIQESQDHRLAQLVVGTRPTLELRNIRLLPNDIDALAFVVNSVCDKYIGLDFGACSMELECLDVLPRCRYIHYLCFRSRKYGDKFAEKLSSILPKFTALRKLEFCGASLTATGAACFASALQNCPHVTEINLSDNNLKDAGIKHIVDVFTKLPRLASVILGRNNSSLTALNYLLDKMSSCSNIQHIHADGMKEMTVTFSQNSDLNCNKPTVSLLNQKWSKPEMEKLAESLTGCPALSVLDLSGGQWDVETLRTLIVFLPRFNITQKIIANDSCSSVEGLVILTGVLSACSAVMELHIRLQSPIQASIVFPGGREKPADDRSKLLCLSSCGLLPAHLERVWKSLGTSSDLTLLDLSGNRLGNKGLRKLLDVLPHLNNIREINASNNGISMEGVMMLAGALCYHSSLTQIHISHGNKGQVILEFSPNQSHAKQQLKIFRINNSSLLPSNVTTLCRKLVQCPSHLELDLSHNSVTGEAIENLLKVLPKMTSLKSLNVSHSISSTAEALMLFKCLTVSQRVTSVELRPHTESFIHFDSVKTKHTSCRLTHLSLNGDDLERLLEILQQGPHLSDLDLSSNQLEDKGVKRFLNSLRELKITSYVNLSKNSLTIEGLLDVASTLCTCENVSGVEVGLGAEERCLIWFTQHEGCEKTLSIRDSSLERAHMVRLAEIVSVCPSLTKLEMKNNFVQSDWIEDFLKLLNSSEREFSVSVEECWINSEEAVNLVCRCLDLNSNIHAIKVYQTTLHLSLMKSTELTPVSCDSADLTPSMATKKIGLVHCAVEGNQLASMKSIIKKCPLLTELDFSHTRLDQGGAEFLCSVLHSLPNLTSLSVASKVPCVMENLAEALLQVPSIQCLNLSGHVIADTAAQILTSLLPRLRLVNLSHCVWSVTGGLNLIKALGECTSLEGLCLDYLQLNEESRICLAQSLRNINSIRSLKLNKISVVDQSGANGVLDLLAAIEGLTRMEEIELDSWMMADEGIEQLTRVLPVWTGLRKISLSTNLISDQSGDKLVETLKSCISLEELHVSGNSLGDLTAARMALVLPSLTHITVLDISLNQIGNKGSVSLSKAIMCMKNLTKINLTSVGTSELCDVAASLAHCALIQDVGLGWNSCGDKVAVELARVMPLCQKLTTIDLESNCLTVVGAEALVRGLQSCPALQLIRLWKNQISPREAQSLSLKDRRMNFSFT
uniref:NLR family, CARD domain containing 5 isoform X2 n=1 Tax=Scatophagus argus TaxID=75038 RepID=UPI001ED81A34|nr:NLR family, CARD domain containing 5 isoform X2 [Scatophagus argus]